MPTRFVDYAEPAKPDDNRSDTAGRAYMRYFNERYQTYGRKVHLFGYYGHYDDQANNVTPEALRADIVEIEARKPFALVPLTSIGAGQLSEDAARTGMVVASYSGFTRDLYRSVSPRLFSYAPDFEESASFAAGYICRRLKGRPASRSGNPGDSGRNRVFGLLYTDHESNPIPGQMARLLKSEVQETCGMSFDSEKRIAAGGRDTYDKYPTAMAQMRTESVTTVIPLTQAGDPLIYLNETGGWYPEWFFVQQFGGFSDDTTSAQVYPQDQWSHAFGVSYDFRRDRVQQQYWFQAFKESCSSCADPTGYFADRTYSVLSLLFYGIQAAGPRLSQATLDRGLHAIPERRGGSPYVPSTYFRPGNYSWVKDAKEMWWDPTGRAPSNNQPGCYRLPSQGRRFRSNEWSNSQPDFNPADPCQGAAQL